MVSQQPYLFLQHDADIAIPNGTGGDTIWGLLAWNTTRNAAPSLDDWTEPNFKRGTPTTIAAGSNGVTLPTGTINVADASDMLPGPAYAAIRTDTGLDDIIRYSRRTNTQLLGCTFGSTQMATGDVVRQALVELTGPYGSIISLFYECAWESNAVGTRAIRAQEMSTGFNLELGGDCKGAVDTGLGPLLRTWAAEQPGTPALIRGGPNGGLFRIQAYQSSGGALRSKMNAASLGYPRLVAADVCEFSNS